MTKVIITARVENGEEWEARFRTHADLFRRQTIASPLKFAVNGNNEVALYSEVEDIDKYMELLESGETAEAMAHDGVDKDSVKVFVLDKELPL